MRNLIVIQDTEDQKFLDVAEEVIRELVEQGQTDNLEGLVQEKLLELGIYNINQQQDITTVANFIRVETLKNIVFRASFIYGKNEPKNFSAYEHSKQLLNRFVDQSPLVLPAIVAYNLYLVELMHRNVVDEISSWIKELAEEVGKLFDEDYSIKFRNEFDEDFCIASSSQMMFR